MNNTEMTNAEKIKNGIHKIWWVPLITGILAIALGIWCFCSPETSLSSFAYFFIGCLIAAGCLNISYSIFNRKLPTNWGWSLALGLLEIICGFWLFSMPAPTLAVAFAYAAGIWMLVVAINSIGEAASFSRFDGAWSVLMIILLVATIGFVVYFLINPILGMAIGWMWIGISLLLFGIWRIALAFKIRSFNKRLFS